MLSVGHAEPRKLSTAQALSGTGVGVSGALFVSAFLVSETGGYVNMPLLYAGLGSSVITPSLGHWYAGEWLTVGMGIRAGAAALATLAVLEFSQEERCQTLEFKLCKGLKGEGVAFLGLAAIAFVGGAAYDLKELPDSVARYNRDHGFTVAPAVVPSIGPTGAPGASLVLTGTF